MIKKIISGGQTGVDQAALDVAIKLDISHGGWIPRGRLTESGPLPQKYKLQETRSSSYSERTEKNVLDADGTLIISRGPLTGGSEYTREMAVKHNRFWLHIDLSQNAAFEAATIVNDWILQKKIAILNVAGPRASKDSRIYEDTVNILESVYYLGLVKGSMSGSIANNNFSFPDLTANSPAPRSLAEAVERLILKMSLKDKTTVANMSPAELPALHSELGGYILNNFALLSGNQALIESCRLASEDKFQHDEDAVGVIIKALWEKLRQTHKLRIIK